MLYATPTLTLLHQGGGNQERGLQFFSFEKKSPELKETPPSQFAGYNPTCICR